MFDQNKSTTTITTKEPTKITPKLVKQSEILSKSISNDKSLTKKLEKDLKPVGGKSIKDMNKIVGAPTKKVMISNDVPLDSFSTIIKLNEPKIEIRTKTDSKSNSKSDMKPTDLKSTGPKPDTKPVDPKPADLKPVDPKPEDKSVLVKRMKSVNLQDTKKVPSTDKKVDIVTKKETKPVSKSISNNEKTKLLLKNILLNRM